MCLSIFFQPVAVGVTGDLIRKSGLANMWLILHSKKNSEIKQIQNERVVLQSFVYEGRKAFEQIRSLVLQSVQGLFWL